MGRGVGHPHRADEGHLAAAPITGAVVGLHHGAVPEGGVGMLGPNPDAALLQHLLGGVFHQFHQGAQGGRLAEFRLTQQACQARGDGASTGGHACFLVALQGLAYQPAAAVELGGQGVPIDLAALAQLQLVAGPALEGRQFVAGLGG